MRKDLYSKLVLKLEALACAYRSRTSNKQEPHANMEFLTIHIWCRWRGTYIFTFSIYRCFIPDSDLKLPDF